MNVTGKLLVSLVMAAIATALISFLQDGGLGLPLLAVIIFAATAATAFTVTLPASGVPAAAPQAPAETPKKKPAKAAATGGQQKTAAKQPAPSGDREQGKVKWFNVSKGFGFITRENGEEVFVHFRSIRGEGRRGLRDGQEVSFVVAQSDKGPQAEDVDPD
jgi:CspA family cold shock protein